MSSGGAQAAPPWSVKTDPKSSLEHGWKYGSSQTPRVLENTQVYCSDMGLLGRRENTVMWGTAPRTGASPWRLFIYTKLSKWINPGVRLI